MRIRATDPKNMNWTAPAADIIVPSDPFAGTKMHGASFRARSAQRTEKLMEHSIVADLVAPSA
ncbi:MAG TPA: hypothetical protein VFW75_05180 [Acetobacteraceae bacterium]|nr:hypothetical protein [Acetobacteraceae bacterium]